MLQADQHQHTAVVRDSTGKHTCHVLGKGERDPSPCLLCRNSLELARAPSAKKKDKFWGAYLTITRAGGVQNSPR
jgi:hypothetical protein